MVTGPAITQARMIRTWFWVRSLTNHQKWFRRRFPSSVRFDPGIARVQSPSRSPCRQPWRWLNAREVGHGPHKRCSSASAWRDLFYTPKVSRSLQIYLKNRGFSSFSFPMDTCTYLHPRPNLIKEGNARLDEFTHEIVMAINEDEKLVIFTGCSHNGILNMVDSVSKRLKRMPIKALIGGFHLLSSPPFKFMAGTRQEVEKIAKAVLNDPIEMTFTGHCTGEKAFHVLKSVMGDRIEDMRTGSYFEI